MQDLLKNQRQQIFSIYGRHWICHDFKETTPRHQCFDLFIDQRASAYWIENIFKRENGKEQKSFLCKYPI